MPLRIVLDVRHIKDFGIGTYIRNLLIALSAIDSKNHYFLTVLPDDIQELPGLGPNFELVAYHHQDSEKIDHIAFPMFVKKLAPDLVHFPLNQIPFLMQKPYVVTIHDLSSLLFGEGSGMRENLRLYGFRRGLLRADCVIAVSEATRRDVEHMLGVPAARIRQVYSAPDPKFLDQHPPSAARAAGPNVWEMEKKRLLERYQINYPFLLYSGRIRPHKNIPRLVEAFAVLRGELENHPVYGDLRLIIIGDEISRHPEVRRTVIQTRMEHCVRFLGFVPFDTLKVFYTAASVFIFPSLYEGFGLPPLEAMASGTPVVTSNASSLSEAVAEAAMIINPENVFDMARGIREVLLDEALRAELIASGFKQVKQFSWHRTATEVLAVYNEVAPGKSAPNASTPPPAPEK
jgi:glycosyltransferase involved in cell wall biosynthesis